jgi:hypothetical protein
MNKKKFDNEKCSQYLQKEIFVLRFLNRELRIFNHTLTFTYFIELQQHLSAYHGKSEIEDVEHDKEGSL